MNKNKTNNNDNVYIAVSSIRGILAKGRFILLFKPNSISLDTKEKIISINNKKKHIVSFDDILGIELTSADRCVDIKLETIDGIIPIHCLYIDHAIKIRDMINVHIWEMIHKNNF